MVEVIEAWLVGSTPLIAALASFIGALTALTTAFVKAWRKLRGPTRRISAVVRHAFNRKNPLFVVGVTLLSVATLIAFVNFRERLSPRARLVAAAWDAVNETQWSKAFVLASECVDSYGPQGEDEQHNLEQEQVIQPRSGKLLPDERQAIFARGLLNDVGACLFIRGQSAERLGRPQAARDAYEAAARLRHARVYDPREDSFWSPASAASARLRKLQ